MRCDEMVGTPTQVQVLVADFMISWTASLTASIDQSNRAVPLLGMQVHVSLELLGIHLSVSVSVRCSAAVRNRGQA